MEVAVKKSERLAKVKESLQACLDLSPAQSDVISLILVCSKAAAALDAANLNTHLTSLELEARLETIRGINVQYGIGNLLLRALRWAVTSRCDGHQESSSKTDALEDLCLKAFKHLKPFVYTSFGASIISSPAMAETLCRELSPTASGNAGSHECCRLSLHPDYQHA